VPGGAIDVLRAGICFHLLISMGRRALRKIDPSLDLSRHLKTWDELPRPWNAEALFGRSAPLEVEVGSGKGKFLQSAASGIPERDFLGIEIARKYARFCAARLARNGVGNALMVHGNAERLFAELMPDRSVAAVHVYFPDPWWKQRHQKRRVMNEPFLRDVERSLVPGGAFHFWTDVEDYFQSSLALVAAATRLEGPFPVPEQTPENDLDFRTHFERRMRLLALPVYRAEFRAQS
jgi:tRNA (guanine-N7-)-methyltransferase